MSYIWSGIFFVLFLHLNAPVYADGENNTCVSVELAQNLANIDTLFRTRNYSRTERAIKDALQAFPENAEILWRYANLVINQGDVSQNAEPLYRRSVEYAKAAVRADSKNANAHAMLAAAYGSVAMYEGGEGKVKLAYKIRDELEIALKLDPDNFFAHTIYGSWQREVADVSWIERNLANIFLGGMPEGSFRKSIAHFKAAEKAEPNVVRNQYELGLTYIAMEREDLAVKEFKRALKMKSTLKADDERKVFMRNFIRDARS